LIPLYINSEKVKSATQAELVKLMNLAVQNQYGSSNVAKFNQASIHQKILLLDDLDICPLGNQGKEKFLSFLQGRFEKAIVTVGENFEISELISGSSSLALADFEHYIILPFGYERRSELVRKWNAIGINDVITNNQFLEWCSKAEKLIADARLQYVASTVPIFVLSLLQASTSGIVQEMQNSSFAHYFYYLIVGAFERAGIRKSDMGRYLSFCTHLSWFIRKNGQSQEITDDQFRIFTADYSQEWTLTEFSEIRDTLLESRLLERASGAYRFSYPYAYYYFLGKYVSTFGMTKEVKDYVDYCIGNLYARECANTLLFVAHHSEDSHILDRIVAVLYTHCRDRKPVTFSKEDIASIAGMVANAPSLVYKSETPMESRNEVNRIMDENDDGHDGLVDTPKQNGERRELMEEIISLSKTIEIAGALLTNQFSSLTRPKKNDGIRAVFDGSLRAIREFYAQMEEGSEKVVQEVADRLSSKKHQLTPSEANTIARTAIAWLLRIVTTSYVVKAGDHLSSPDLSDNIRDVVAKNPTLAYRLIEVSQKLDSPLDLPRLELNSLIKDEEDNPCVMSVLQMLVLQRMYMYETRYDDKDWALEVFGLSGRSNSIELRHNKRIAVASSGSGASPHK
jgi:hypothetical protein